MITSAADTARQSAQNRRLLQSKSKKKRSTFRRLLSYAAGIWPMLVTLHLCIICSSLLDLARPWIIGFQLFDLVIRKQDLSRLPFVVLLLSGSFVGQQILDFSADVLQEISSQRLVNRLRCDLYEHTLALPVVFFDRGRTGDLLARITSDIDTLENFLDMMMQNIGSEFVQLFGTLAAMLAVSVKLTVFLLPTVVALACSVLFFRKPVKRFSRAARNLVGEIATLAEEAICGVRVVKAFCGEDFELERFTQKCKQLLSRRVRLKKISAVYSSSVNLCVFSGTLIVVWFAPAWVVSSKTLTIGGLVAFLTYTTKLYSPVKALSKLNLSIQKILAAGDRVFEVMDIAPESANGSARTYKLEPGPRSEELVSPAEIRFENISFGYDAEHPVLRNLSLHIKPGELVALIGPSGAGKTTIVNLLLRFYEPTSGRILIDGVPIDRMPLPALRRQIGLVSQETFLFSGTSRDNIAYAAPDANEAEIVRAARHACAHDFLSQAPSGYSTQIGERGVQLSGGQRQRVAIARALLRNPRIMIFDEATSHLDVESERIIQETLERIAERRTILVVAHRFSTIRRADKIVVIENGTIVESGRHDELVAQGGRYSRVLSLHMQASGVKSRVSENLSQNGTGN